MVEGDLADLPLASLLAVLEHEHMTAVLRVQRGADQGALYVRDGAIVHATAVGAVGNVAVRQLLTRGGGHFTLSREAVAQPRTVTRSLSEFLSPGRGAAAAHAAAPAAAPEPDYRAADAALFAELLELLTRLEHDRAKLAEGRVAGADACLLTLVGIVNTLVEFTLARRSDAVAQPASVIAKLAPARPYAQLFEDGGGRVTIDAVLAALEGEQDTGGERRRMVLAIADALVDLLAVYARLVAGLLHGSGPRDDWQMTADVFIEDLRNAVQQLDIQDKGDAHGQEMRARRR